MKDLADPTNSFAALDLGEQYTRKLGTRSLFTEQAFLYPDLSQTGQFQLAADSTFSTKLGKILNWQTTFSDRYTSFPPSGAGSSRETSSRASTGSATNG